MSAVDDVPSVPCGASLPLRVLQTLNGQKSIPIWVELTTGYRYDGFFESVDDLMNLRMSNVVMTSTRRPGAAERCASVFVFGSKVTLIGLPPQVEGLLSRVVAEVKQQIQKKKPSRSRKAKKA